MIGVAYGKLSPGKISGGVWGKTALLREWECSWEGGIMSADSRLLGKFSGFIVMLHKGATEVIIQTCGCPMGFLWDFILVQTAMGTKPPWPVAAALPGEQSPPHFHIQMH